jgi:hypothetical protein
MPRMRVTFKSCIQDSQEYRSDHEHMVSRLFFTLDDGMRRYTGLYADLKQAMGASYETGPIEVGPPVGYDGPFNHESFRRAAERYFPGLVGSTGTGIRIEGGSNIRMQDNRFFKEESAEFDVS